MQEHSEYCHGQRWASDAEPELGLGMIAEVAPRTIDIYFAAADKTRTYTKAQAPITRVIFAVGDTVKSRENHSLVIHTVQVDQGLVIYSGQLIDESETKSSGKQPITITEWPETSLNDFIQVTDTKSRLFNGQVDGNQWFELRMLVRETANTAARNPVYGLAGARVAPLPHQLYIANKTANRYAPRVLLADEVGLGKTIEACMIVHRLLLLGRVHRVLVIVPDVLVNQWLVEWLRRFNLKFSIFDGEKLSALANTGDDINPFDTEQLVLCGVGLFKQEPTTQNSVLHSEWDVLVIDEAHHIEWSPNQNNEFYDFIQTLSNIAKSVLLLTATPEQLGETGHFARLHLLDPVRFDNYESFVSDHSKFHTLSTAVTELLEQSSVSAETLNWLSQITADDKDDITGALDNFGSRQQLARQLIDLHGTSRALFRNTRARITGFPKRILNSYPLTANDDFIAGADNFNPATDPRTHHLIQTLKTTNQKILLICASVETVISLEKHLRERYGILTAVFHERLSIVERDRAAAYFADPESKAQLLICSEIGSEGRNFQFAQHLYLFDLPRHPDLLEQRVGRLDRIGQKSEIFIHVPYIKHTHQEILFRWYHEGMQAFTQTNGIGQNVYTEFSAKLDFLLKQKQFELCDVDSLIKQTKQIHQQTLKQTSQGRDRLIEVASYDPDVGNSLVARVTDNVNKNSLVRTLTQAFDTLGIMTERRDRESFVLRPDPNTQTVSLPGISDEGVTATYEREYALTHENIEYLTWEHPLTRQLVDIVLTGEQGKCTAITNAFKLLPNASLLVESQHIVDLNTLENNELARFFSQTSYRSLLNESLRDMTKLLGMGKFWVDVRNIDSPIVRKLVNLKRAEIEKCLAHAMKAADTILSQQIQSGYSALNQYFEDEQRRLAQLGRRFNNIHNREIETLNRRHQICIDAIENAAIRLDAVRLIIIKH